MSDHRAIAPALDPVDLPTALAGAVPNGFATLIDADGASAHPQHLQTAKDSLLDCLDQTVFHHPVTKMPVPHKVRATLAGDAASPSRFGFLNDRGGERQ